MACQPDSACPQTARGKLERFVKFKPQKPRREIIRLVAE